MEDPNAQGLLHRLMAIQAALKTNMAKQAADFGLSVAQITVAQDLAENPGTTLQQVCGRLGWPKSSVSRLVDDLVSRNVAIREIPSSNRRTVLLSLKHSSDGCFPATFDGVFPGAGGPLDPQEALRLQAALDRILVLLTPRQK